MIPSDKARLLTPAQTAEFLGVTLHTLAEWRSQRRGPPYVKLEGRLVRYRFAELEGYITEHSVQSSDLTCAMPSGRLRAL